MERMRNLKDFAAKYPATNNQVLESWKVASKEVDALGNELCTCGAYRRGPTAKVQRIYEELIHVEAVLVMAYHDEAKDRGLIEVE